MPSSFWKKLRGYDAYPKTAEDFRVRTLSGAIVSIISNALILYLIFAELQLYLVTGFVCVCVHVCVCMCVCVCAVSQLKVSALPLWGHVPRLKRPRTSRRLGRNACAHVLE